MKTIRYLALTEAYYCKIYNSLCRALVELCDVMSYDALVEAYIAQFYFPQDSKRTKVTKYSSGKSVSTIPTKPDPMESVGMARGTFRKPVKSAFYTEHKNNVGVIFKEFPGNTTNVRKAIGRADIPDKEAQVSAQVNSTSVDCIGCQILY